MPLIAESEEKERLFVLLFIKFDMKVLVPFILSTFKYALKWTSLT